MERLTDMTDCDLTNDLSLGELNAAKTTINSLLVSLKMFTLYTENHTNCEQMLGRFHDNLTAFLSEYGSLTISVHRSELCYEGEVIYNGTSQEGDIAFSLFRDGVRWLEFSDGFEPWETRQILKILHQFRSLPVETEGDLVTALWDAHFPHLHYDAIENILDGDLQVDDLTAPGPMQQEAALLQLDGVMPQETMPEPTAYSAAVSHAHVRELAEIDITALELTVADVLSLQEMVALEESLDPTREVLDMLVDILDGQKDEELLILIVQFLSEELSMALKESQFGIALKILKGLHHILQNGGEKPPQALQQIESLLLSFCRPESLGVLEENWTAGSPSEHEAIQEILLLLPPEVISTLGPMLIEAKLPSVRKMLKSVVRSHAERDIKPLEALLDASGEQMALALIDVLDGLDEERSLKIFLRMIRHPSERVRREVMKTLMMKDVWLPDKLFPLIEDKSSSVRRLLYTYLGSRKSEITERFLINYLDKRKVGGGDKDDLMACFRTLGRCGSERAISFMQEIFAGCGLASRIFGSPNLQAAALGLQVSGMEAAEQVLKGAARSIFPGVRRAAKGVILVQEDLEEGL